MKIIGWCDPYWRATTPCPHTWHVYQDDKWLSCCGKWYWDDDDDMDPMPSPPEGAKVCKTCAKLAALEAAQSSGETGK